MPRRIIFSLFLIASAIDADEIRMKDGKSIQWKSMTDEGENYSVETKEGQKILVKKADIERLVIGVPAAVPLTGASFTFDPKKTLTTDLMSKAKTEDTSGAWKLTNKVLSGTASWPSRAVLVFDHDLPEEYDLSLSIERTDNGNKDFDVGISTGGTACAYHFDCWDATTNCLALVSGQEGPHTDGQIFRNGKPRHVKIMVRKDALAVQVDGKDFWKGRVDWKQASLLQGIGLRERGKPFLIAAGGSWKVTAFSLIQPK
jgi:hypothetical protein